MSVIVKVKEFCFQTLLASSHISHKTLKFHPLKKCVGFGFIFLYI